MDLKQGLGQGTSPPPQAQVGGKRITCRELRGDLKDREIGMSPLIEHAGTDLPHIMEMRGGEHGMRGK